MAFSRAAALIADDDDFFRLALGVILLEQLEVSEIIETDSLDGAMDAIASSGVVNFAFFDLNMPGLDTFTGIRATREAFPDVRVAVVSGSRNRKDVLRALDAGAHGFVSKGGGVKQLASAIRVIGNGDIFIPAFLADIRDPQGDTSVPEPEKPSGPPPRPENITLRQQEVLQCLVRGMSNKQIARDLGISESAVKFHVASLCGRLGVRNRTEIAAQASRVLC